MPPFSAQQILERQFLETRAKILQIAAELDRLDRADGEISGDPRFAQLQAALQELQSESPGRAQRVQMIFSRAYDPNWKNVLELPAAS